MRNRLVGHPLEPTTAWGTARKVKRFFPVAKEFLLDFSKYFKHSLSNGIFTEKNLRGKITETFHNIEKGLSLPNPRLGFGEDKIADLIEISNHYKAKFGIGSPLLLRVRDTLRAYREMHERNAVSPPHSDLIDKFIEEQSQLGLGEYGGLREVTKKEIVSATSGIGHDFFLTRHSVRQFSDQPVGLEQINQAIEAALKSPAVCNRQFCHAVVIADKDLIAEVLRMQGGARGFQEGIDKLIVVLTRLSHFFSAGERNQPWIDGGLFSMSLLLSLHQQGLGSCCLNWSKTNAQTQAMKSFLHLDDDSEIVMMIAVGNLLEKFSVAKSHRQAVDQSSRVITGWLSKD